MNREVCPEQEGDYWGTKAAKTARRDAVANNPQHLPRGDVPEEKRRKGIGRPPKRGLQNVIQTHSLEQRPGSTPTSGIMGTGPAPCEQGLNSIHYPSGDGFLRRRRKELPQNEEQLDILPKNQSYLRTTWVPWWGSRPCPERPRIPKEDWEKPPSVRKKTNRTPHLSHLIWPGEVDSTWSILLCCPEAIAIRKKVFSIKWGLRQRLKRRLYQNVQNPRKNSKQEPASG